MVRRNWIGCWSLLWLGLAGLGAQAAEVQVAVAANFSGTMKVLSQVFQQESGHQASIITGATGKFYAQIKNGAPFQVLLAADAQTPLLLEEEGFAVPGSRFTYAVGRLVLWCSRRTSAGADGGNGASQRPAGAG